MKKHTSLGLALIVFLGLIGSLNSPALSQTLADYTNYPPFVSIGGASAPPLTMFVMSKDHKNFYKAYNDFTDLDDDGTIDKTYKDAIEYYGYFDSDKCYSYSGSRFEPSAYVSNHTSDPHVHYCTNQWSGNFLNWATMARIDIVRKVLFGGKRVVDNNNTSVLGRTTLPQDAHSWVKAYNGSDISSLTPYSWSGISLCNTNTSSVGQQGDTSLIFAIRGYHPYATSTEVVQCVKTFEGTGSVTLSENASPSTDGEYVEFNADVLVCVIGLLEDNCGAYKPGSSAIRYKPEGLLQKFGVDRKGNTDDSDDEFTMKFGLITGTDDNNHSGGILRAHITDLNAEISTSNGQTQGNSKIISPINNFEITSWNYSSKKHANTESWGNPIGEMYYEAIRYMMGKTAGTDEYEVGVPNGQIDTWTDAYANCPYCSKPFIVLLTDASPSFDSNELPGSYWPTSINTSDTPSVQTLIDDSDINILESIGQVVIGQEQNSTDNKCTKKPSSGSADFGEIRGLCVDEPTREGSYYIAGLAHYAKTTDLRPSLTGDQVATTFSVVTGSTTPKLEFDVGGDKVQLAPIFHDGCPSASGFAGCSTQGQNGDNSKGQIVDFQACPDDAEWTTEQGLGFTFCYEILWDDSEEGGDYDLDIRHRFFIKNTSTTITIKTKGKYAAAGHTGFAGYIISGVTTSGEYYDLRCGGGLAGNNDCDRADDGNETAEKERTFTADGSSSGFLENPLWYAAKYGGFDDVDGSDTPNLTAEWDANADGVPDTYFDASNPLKLEEKLTEVLTEILERSSSGTSVSVLATSSEGEGALYQAYFYPTIRDEGAEKKWIGYLHSLFLDSFGNLREDTVQDGKLVLTDDKIVRTYFDVGSGESLVDKFVDADGDGKADSTTATDPELPISEIKPLWEAGEELAKMNAADRKIWTWLNANDDSVVDAGEFRSFDTTLKTTLIPYLRATDDDVSGDAIDESEDIIKFIRGEQPTGMRDRLITIPSEGAQKVWKLGDIVYSTPTVVAAPSERYDLLYGDFDYSDFYTKYKDRRNVVYVGANDGMLHAFNAGFYTPGDDTSTTTVVEHGRYTPGTGKTLGQELWAFIPYELLPHLKWLTRPDYTHVDYVDLKPKVTDVQIFADDADHPGGWGTILIGGMRFGGGPITVTDTTNFPSPTTRTFRSAYFVLDITNPETDPVLLGSFTDSELGYTNSFPAVIRVSDSGITKWYVMVGTGPTTYTGSSGQTAKIKIFDLNTTALTLANTKATTLSNAFMGDPINVDANVDFTTDIAYIGSSYLDTGVWRGDMFRLSIQNKTNPADWVLSTLYQANPGPIIAAPTAAFGNNNDFWVYFGTGRYITLDDVNDTSQQSFYGIKDACWNDITCTTTVTEGDLLHSSGFSIKADGTTSGGPKGTFDALLTEVIYSASNKGWYVDLASKERVFTKSTVLGGIVFFTSFVPDGDVCIADGNSFIHGLYFETGTAYKKSPFGDPPPADPSDPIVTKKALGQGLPSAIGIHMGSSTNDGSGGTCAGGVKGFVQQSTGIITEVCGDPIIDIRSGVKRWRDF